MSEVAGSSSVSRRAVLAGLAGGGVLLAGSHVQAADDEGAPPDTPDTSDTSGGGRSPVPRTTTSASPRQPGVLYATRCMYDFICFAPTAQRAWGGNGVYSVVTASALRTTVDLPAGAVLQDVEWYVYNSSGSTVSADLLRWEAGSGTLQTVVATSFPSTGGIAVHSSTVSPALHGPFSPGS
jgi:hypothetical protein